MSLSPEKLRDILSETAGDPDADATIGGRELGFALAVGQLICVAMQRHLLPQSPTEAHSFEEFVTRVAPAVQLQLDLED